MVSKLEKQLNFTCPTCFAFFQLLETHEPESTNCEANCLKQWQAVLSKHYQDCIILHLAQQEAEKEEQN